MPTNTKGRRRRGYWDNGQVGGAKFLNQAYLVRETSASGALPEPYLNHSPYEDIDVCSNHGQRRQR